MKKLMRKLVLSSFALGLAVITLSTTTFAWYTSNTVVTADGVQSSTSASGQDLLMITQYKTEERTVDSKKVIVEKEHILANLQEWKTSIPTVFMSKKDELIPMQLVNGFNLVENGTSTDDKGSGYLEFTLCFKNAGSSLASLYVTEFNIEHIATETVLPSKDIISVGRSAMGTYGADQNNVTYKVDVLRTLMVAAQVRTMTHNADDTDTFVNTSTKVYNPELVNTSNLLEDNFGENWNAHTYYNAIMEDRKLTDHLDGYDYDAINILPYGATGVKKALKLADVLPAGNQTLKNQYVEITFKVFINGWDVACFDACKEQNIKISLGFTSVEPDSANSTNYLWCDED